MLDLLWMSASRFKADADGVADGRALACGADFQPVQNADHGVVVPGQGQLRVGVGAEDHHADAVTVAFGDEFLHHPFDGLQPVDDASLLS